MATFLTNETRQGEPIAFKSVRLVPITRTFSIRIPGFPAILVWNRPVSVRVIGSDGQEQILPIQDVTRLMLWALAGATLFIWLISWLTRKSQ
jgi:hypothetical protein